MEAIISNSKKRRDYDIADMEEKMEWLEQDERPRGSDMCHTGIPEVENLNKGEEQN